MKRLKKMLKMLGLVLLIILASMGIGVPLSLNSREKYMNREVRIEQVEKRNDETDEESDSSDQLP